MFNKYKLEDLSIFWKNDSFKDIKVGDIIFGDEIIHIFTFTIWGIKKDQDNHSNCSGKENCS